MFFCGFCGVPERVSVCVLRRGVGWKQDFRVDDFAFVGIVFLLLVVFRKEPLATLIGSGSNGGLAVTALDDFDVIVWAWQVWFLLSPGFGHKKSREPKIDFLLGGAAGERLIFSYKWLPDDTLGSAPTGTGKISFIQILYPENLMEWGLFRP